MANRNLSYGSTGSDVKALQKQLKSLGYYKNGAIDGIFGPQTKAAVRQFQQKAKITVDGIVGPQTRSALQKAINNKNKKKSTKKNNKNKKTTKTKTTTKVGATTGSTTKVDATKPRQAKAVVSYDPAGKGAKNTRNSSEMDKYLESFIFTDPATGESDSASIELSNIGLLWASKYLPKKGDKFTAYIESTNWTKPGESKRLNCGTFCCDDRNFTFPGSCTATINGTSVPEKQAFRSTERSKTWKNVTIQEIARKIAAKYKLKVYYEADTVKIKTLEQTNKDDCGFLKDLCSDYGLYIKVHTGNIWIYDASRYEKKKAATTIDYTEIISADYNSSLAGTYTGATIKYTSGTGKGKKEYTYKTGSGSRILNISEKVDSLSDAKIKAVAKLKEANREAETMRLTVIAAGKPLLSANCFTLKNCAEMSGKWFIDKATHKVSGTGGYTIDLDAHRVAESKKDGLKTTTTATKPAKATLKYGSKGTAVKSLQKQLKSLGLYKSGALDGSFGPLTRTAVKQFQRKAGIKADGIVGAKTWAAIEKALKKK